MSEKAIRVDDGHHKSYTGQSRVLEVPVQDILGGADPSKHGLVLKRKGEDMPYASIRPPLFRSLKNDPLIHEDDVVNLYAEKFSREKLEIPNHFELNCGSETETLTIHEEVRNNGHEKISPAWNAQTLIETLEKRGIHTSPELWSYMLEVNSTAHPNTEVRLKDFMNTFRIIWEVVEELNDGIRILPVSSLPFEAHREHLNPHPYIQRMVKDVLGWSSVKELGTSFQVHVAIPDIKSAIFAVNNLRQIPHIFMAMALNGPFQHHEYSERLSARESARRKMYTAGSMPQIPDWELALQNSVDMLKIGKVPSLPRAISQHLDFRIRPDISPKGTIEIAFMDDPGGHIDKMIMLQEFLRLTVWRLYKAYQSEEILPEELFSTNYDYYTEFNKNQVETEGSLALIKMGPGIITNSLDQAKQLLDWAKSHPDYKENPNYKFEVLEKQVFQSLSIPSFDSIESRSMEKFYQSGLGTPGHYQKAYFEYWVGKNLSETEAINMALVDYADSYHNYLNKLKTL